MRLDKSIEIIDTAGITSQTDLLSNVSLLADCLARAASMEGCGDTEAHQEAATRALIAAIECERRMADLRERVLYMERLAMTDELTGLLNRRGFSEELQRTLAAARRYEEQGILIYIDLDGFKPINDTYGHDAGDEVLRNVGRLLRDIVRETDYVARLGGDEFAVLLTRSRWDDGMARAEAIDEALNSLVIAWKGRMVNVRASIGIQAYGPDDDGHGLLSQADQAMYRTKRGRAELTAGRAAA